MGNWMKNLSSSLVIVIMVVGLHAAGSIARECPLDSSLSAVRFLQSLAASTLSDSGGPIPWPTLYGVHQTNSVNTAFDCFGTIGMSPIARTAPYPFWPTSSFESPPGSGHQYLWAGAIWIGGIVGGDTIVTAGFTNWNIRQEMYPTGFPATSSQGTVTPFEHPTALSLRAEFDDTIHTGITYSPDYFGQPYRPVNVAVVNRTHSFEGQGADECIVHDVLVTNIGPQAVRQGYFGIYLDADVYSTHGDLFGYTDDLAGSIRSQGVAYIVDNDGDPAGGLYNPDRSPTKILAFKFLNSSFLPRDTNFNWWVPSNNPQFDFGPRQKDYPRDFGTGGTGSPIGDGNEYYVISTPEWDYDQVMTATILPDDPTWEYPNPLTTGSVHRGRDTRFLMSIGPFDLLPDSTIRVQFAVFTADSVHTDPFILDFVDVAPELYALTLNLPGVTRNAAIADSLGNLLSGPALPPTGLRTAVLLGDTAIVTWDPWAFSNVDSCDVYLSAIPDTAFRHGGVIPPWYRPADYRLADRVNGTAKRCVLPGLSPGQAYACNVALRSGSQAGTPSMPLLFRIPDARYAVRIRDSLLLVTQGSNPVIRWHNAGSGGVDHFNVYRFVDSTEAREKYSPFYSRWRLDIDPVDSVVVDDSVYFYYALPVYALVPGDMFEYEDPLWSDGNVYAVTAVDSSGTEFPFSPLVTAYRIPPRTKDICVLTNSGGRVNFVLGTTLKEFYASILNGYQYDIFSYIDTLSTGCGMYMEQCIDWRDFAAYRTLIIDDGLKDALFSSRFEDRTNGFHKYLESGGTIVYFGSFSSVGGYSLGATTDPAWFDLPDPMVTDHFGVDSVFYAGVSYYQSHTVAPYVDSLFGFVRGQSMIQGAPDIRFDLSRNPFTVDLATYWPASTAPSVSTFKVDSRGEVSHIYRSASPATSVNERQPVGVITKLAKGQTFLFGFHLWYMEPAGARQLVDWIMDRVTTGASDESSTSLPATATLSQNYPNPFNPSTTIEYAVPNRSNIRLELFNILGQNVRTLVNELKPPGEYKAVWDGKDNRARPVSTGVYLYRLRVGDAVLTKKMLLLK